MRDAVAERFLGGEPRETVSAGQRFWMADVDTRSFSFMAFGKTKEEAREALKKGWEKHAEKTGASMSWEELDEDTNYFQVQTGVSYRDREKLA